MDLKGAGGFTITWSFITLFENMTKKGLHTVCLIWKFSTGGRRTTFLPSNTKWCLNHREHTILLSRERVNKRTKRMTEQFTFVSCSHLFYLTRFYLENCCLQILRNTVMLNSYLGLSALSKIFFMVYIKFDKGGNSLPKHFERTANRGRCL